MGSVRQRRRVVCFLQSPESGGLHAEPAGGIASRRRGDTYADDFVAQELQLLLCAGKILLEAKERLF